MAGISFNVLHCLLADENGVQPKEISSAITYKGFLLENSTQPQVHPGEQTKTAQLQTKHADLHNTFNTF